MNSTDLGQFVETAARADALVASGQHIAAVDTLKTAYQALMNAKPAHLEIYSTLYLLEIAEHQFHNNSINDSIKTLNQIPKNVRDLNPHVAARFSNTRGLNTHRLAHAQYRSGDNAAAREYLREAQSCFEQASLAAALARDSRVKLNADMNRIYSHGLLAWLNKNSAAVNLKLMDEMAEILSALPNVSAPEFQNNATGYTMLADLAFGAKISLAEWKSNEVRPEDIFAKNETWQDVLITIANAPFAGSPIHKLRAYALAAKYYRNETSGYISTHKQRIENLRVQLGNLLYHFDSSDVVFGGESVKPSYGGLTSANLARAAIQNLNEILHSPFKQRRIFR